MVRTNILKVNQSLYARIPAEEARRLRIREGQEVELQVKPIGATGTEILRLKGKYKGQFANLSDEELWGE